MQADRTLVLRGARIFTPRERPDASTLVVSDGRVVEISDDAISAPGCLTVELEGLIVAPGFIDIQINGAFGCDVMSGDAATLRRLASMLASRGCTAFLPTVVTAERQRLIKALRAIAEASHGPTRGARILGAHLEGPYISPEYAGAHDPTQIRPFDHEEWDVLRAASEGRIRIVTLAPEVPANYAAIPMLRAQGVVVSAGHTGATYDQLVAATRSGLRLVTHAGNAMRGLHHREPGALGAALDSEALVPSVIADGIHLHPATLRLLVRAKGAARAIAITDAAWVAGLPAGEYRWEGRDVTFDGAAPRLKDGRLAGSGLMIDVAVSNLVRLAGLDLSDAIAMATTSPSQQLQLGPLGELAVGGPADFVVLDKDLRVQATFVAGEPAYVADTAPPNVQALTGRGPHFG